MARGSAWLGIASTAVNGEGCANKQVTTLTQGKAFLWLVALSFGWAQDVSSMFCYPEPGLGEQKDGEVEGCSALYSRPAYICLWISTGKGGWVELIVAHI